MIDLRSDTVTQPTAAMRAAMLAAPVGDDVYGEDPTVAALQTRLAQELGFEAGLFAPSGTQANLIALLCHCQRGDEYLVGMDAHTYKFEGGGAAVLGSIQPQPIPHASDGTLPLDALQRALKPDDIHYAHSRLLAVENTWHGRVLPQAWVREACHWAHANGLVTHLDGARLFNASVASGTSARELCEPFDSVSVCLSKGLGAPVGSVLLGSHALIHAAKRWRKMLGGGMRQAGILAAGAIHALDHHVARLAQDHARAEHLAHALQGIADVRVIGQHTNMVFIEVPTRALRTLAAHVHADGINLGLGKLGTDGADVLARTTLRLVTHLDIDDAGIDAVARSLSNFFTRE